MNALLYLGVPMMAKFSPELNMVRSDAYPCFRLNRAGLLITTLRHAMFFYPFLPFGKRKGCRVSCLTAYRLPSISTWYLVKDATVLMPIPRIKPS
jgi:hypothetical protein